MTPLHGRPRGKRPEPAEIEALDRALRGIEMDERCSFGAELRSELVKECDRLRRGEVQPLPIRRRLRWRWAAVIVLVAAGVLSIPQTRSVLLHPFRADPPEVSTTVDPVRSPGKGSGPARFGAVGLSAAMPSAAVVAKDSVLATLPVIADRSAARRIVAKEYPPPLQERGVGGTVRILAWVNPWGGIELVQIDSSSGVAELDRAAVRAAQAMRFQPATRLGEAVGTWVALPIRFLPNATEVEVEPESEALRIPLSN